MYMHATCSHVHTIPIHTCTHICNTHAHAYTEMYVPVLRHICMHACSTHSYKHVETCISILRHTCMHSCNACTCRDMHSHTIDRNIHTCSAHLHTHLCAHLHTQTCMPILIDMCIDTYVYNHTYIFIYVQRQGKQMWQNISGQSRTFTGQFLHSFCRVKLNIFF